MPRPPTLDDLRRYAVARTLFRPTTLAKAIDKLGFVQADPIRAPARAQDLILRHRVAGYRAGDLERRYARLPVEEDALVNYGFLPRRHLALLHPRTARRDWGEDNERKAADVLAFVREQGAAHPQAVEARFAHGRVVNWFGGTSNAATQLLDGMHYRSLLRVARRQSGTRVYTAIDHPSPDASDAARAARAKALLDLVVRLYAPLPSASLGHLVTLLLVFGAPQLKSELKAALRDARTTLAGTRIDGTPWLWPADEDPRSKRWKVEPAVRLLAPFDPIVWDRRRFELFWQWPYHFEAYTPAAKRKLGYYALPLLFGDRVVGWVNASVRAGRLATEVRFVEKKPRDPAFADAWTAERARFAAFLGL